MTVLEIVKEYLIGNGYDGLYDDNAGCGCKIDDLSPADCICEYCEAGHLIPLTEEQIINDYDFAIGRRDEN